jgi:DNA polymerase-3 subunit gamma/tau
MASMTEQAALLEPYRVLARKYRPGSFAELIGQDAMVRTLRNAIAQSRIAHAFILTGVRGVGKTTTARIIARVLNCVGPDGNGGPTADPCGECEHCRAIAEDRHVDVMEMDAASRTGVDDIRELIEGVRYRPVTARYKVYIIDEVHMLSRNAFNALLKTLEEPPEHVKFVFATTEIRKVPITVLSRCQRFDLRRVDAATLIDHFARIAAAEGVEIAPAALRLIARAADGSVRDGLSLLDQAMAHAGGPIAEAEVRDMLGLADGGRVYDLFDALMRGEAGAALDLLAELHRSGADPAVVLQDLLELVHFLTRIKIVARAADDAPVSDTERERARAMAGGLSMSALARAWQMLLKGLAEVRAAPSDFDAAEMVLVRLAFAAELPTPSEIVARLGDGGAQPASSGAVRAAPVATPRPSAPAPSGGAARPRTALAAEPAPRPDSPPTASASAAPRSFEEAVALFAERREGVIYAHLVNDVHLVRFEPGQVELRLGAGAPATLANRIGECLTAWTARRWVVGLSNEPGAPTLRQSRDAAAASKRAAALDHPLVKAALQAFPEATVEAVRESPAAADVPETPPDDDAPMPEGDDDP